MVKKAGRMVGLSRFLRHLEIMPQRDFAVL
jgi:hypothetical protein